MDRTTQFCSTKSVVQPVLDMHLMTPTTPQNNVLFQNNVMVYAILHLKIPNVIGSDCQMNILKHHISPHVIPLNTPLLQGQ